MEPVRRSDSVESLVRRDGEVICMVMELRARLEMGKGGALQNVVPRIIR